LPSALIFFSQSMQAAKGATTTKKRETPLSSGCSTSSASPSARIGGGLGLQEHTSSSTWQTVELRQPCQEMPPLWSCTRRPSPWSTWSCHFPWSDPCRHHGNLSSATTSLKFLEKSDCVSAHIRKLPANDTCGVPNLPHSELH